MKTSSDFDSNSGFFSDYQNYFQKAYQLQTDLEEAKRQEILKLQYSMQAIQAKVDETNALLTKERESALMHLRIAHQVAHLQLIQNTREKDALQEAKDKLQAQVEDLTLHLELEKRLKTDLEEAKGHEILELQNSLQAMQAKVNVTNALLTMDRESAQKKIDKLSAQVEELKSLLELERNRKQCESSEIKQQKLEETENRPNQLLESMNRLEEKLTNLESENKVLRQQVLAMAGQLKSILDLHSPSMQLKNGDIKEKPQKSLNEKQQIYQDVLNQCITHHLGFSKGRPVAACIIYKCLRWWRSFEVEKTSIFYRITQTIGQAIETQDKNNEVLAYWLSNVSTLLLLLQHTLEQDEVNCHAFLFKQKLTEYVEKIYGMIRDNLKKEILPFLKLCIQASIDFEPELLHRTADSQDILIAHWQGIHNNLDSFLSILKSYHVIFNLRILSKKELDDVESSSLYLQDKDSSIPFSVDDLSKSMDEINIEDVEPPPLICDILPKSLWPSSINKSVGEVPLNA